MKPTKLMLSLVPLLLVAIGCNEAKQRVYDVTVKNESSQPVTIWLTKNGPPWEDGWKSPEDLAIESPQVNERIGGVVVPPGKTAFTGKRTGLFAPRVEAILRIYHGQKLFNEILAVGRDSPNRTDVVLEPGVSQIIVADNGPLLKVTRSSVSP
jgi:hypothetical protein